jgi:hypothetical protein
MNNKLLMFGIIMIISIDALISQSIDGYSSSCPGNSISEGYTAKDFPSGCKYTWEVSKGHIVSGNQLVTTLSESTNTYIDVKWDEVPSYVNSLSGFSNNGSYPTGWVKVTSVGCNNPITKTKIITITSIKDYAISAVKVDYSSKNKTCTKDNNNPLDLTADNPTSIKIDAGYYTTIYNSETGQVLYPARCYWTLPAGWTASGQGTKTAFETGTTITVTPPSCYYGTSELKVRILTPENCFINNKPQEGADFVLKLNKDNPAIISLSPVSIQWGVPSNFTITATTNNSNGLSYYWTLPANLWETSTGNSGSLSPKTTPTVNVSTNGCSTSQQISLVVKNNTCGVSSNPKTLNITYTYPYQVTGPTIVCSSGGTFFVNKPVVTGLSAVFTHSSNLYDYYGGSNYTAVKPIGNGYGSITATLINSCGQRYTVPSFGVWVGVPPTPSSWFDIWEIRLGSHQRVDIAYATVGQATSWNWYPGSYTISCQQTTYNTGVGYIGNEIYSIGAFPGDVPLYFTSNNTCGESNRGSTTIRIISNSKSTEETTSINEIENKTDIKIYPNPASTEVEFTIDELFSENNEYSIAISNILGTIIYNGMMQGRSIKINTSGWKKGIYFAKIKNVNTTFKGTFIIN